MTIEPKPFPPKIPLLFLSIFALSWISPAMGQPGVSKPVVPNAAQESDLVKSFQKVRDSNLALFNVKIIDGLGNPAKSHQVILIQNGKIVNMGPVDKTLITSGFRKIDHTGYTVIPGIVGTHNHMRLSNSAMLFTSPRLYLACGVTTIQTCGTGNPKEEIAIGRAIDRGEIPGPKIVNSSPYFTGPDGKPHFIRFTDEKSVREHIRFWANEGVKWFKVYRHTRPGDLKVIIDEAHKNNAKVTGHLCATTYQQAAELGIDAIEHGFIHSYDHASGRKEDRCSGDVSFRSELDIADKEVQQIHQLLIDKNVALTSTLAIFATQARGDVRQEIWSAMAPSHRKAAELQLKSRREKGANWYFKEEWLLKSMEYDLAFFRAGGLLTAGLDPGLHNLPGYGDQKNYELLIEAGFHPKEAIKVMTSNGAKLLGIDSIGKIQIGMTADLVVIKGDLESNPELIHSIDTVYKNGKGYDPEKLIKSIQGHVGSTMDEEMTYFGQKPPQTRPEIFAPHIVSKPGEYEFGSVFSKDGKTFFYAIDEGSKSKILFSKLENGVWSIAEPLIVDEKYSFNDPMLSPDENRLYFISDKPLEPNVAKGNIDIWYLERKATGWSAPVHAGNIINSTKNEYYISFTDNGAMYFASNTESKENRPFNFDIYKSEFVDGEFLKPEKLPESINSKYYEADVFIAPDESYIIFCAIRKDGYGKGDLYISFRDENKVWSEAVNLGDQINNEHHQLCPFVSKDGKYFFFTSNQDIYWVSTEIFKEFKNP